MTEVKSASVRRRKAVQAAESTPKPPPSLSVSKPGTANFLKMVLFGPPKTGKTVGACAGEGKKLLILCEPDGDLPLLGREDIDVVRPQNGKELYQIIQTLHSGVAEQYDWVILDSVTFAFEIIGYKMVGEALEKGVDVRRPYGQVGASLVQMIHDLVALKTNVIFIAQLRENFVDDDDPDAAGAEEGKYPFTMAVTPMVYKILSPAVSVLGRSFKRMFVNAKGNKEVQFFVSFEDYGKSPAGSRIPVPDRVENFNPDTLVQQLKGETK